MSIADKLRAQKSYSTDPDRLEREAQKAEGAKFLANMPGDGPWKLRHTPGGIVAISETHGAFHLELVVDGLTYKGRWSKILLP